MKNIKENEKGGTLLEMADSIVRIVDEETPEAPPGLGGVVRQIQLRIIRIVLFSFSSSIVKISKAGTQANEIFDDQQDGLKFNAFGFLSLFRKIEDTPLPQLGEI